ncbi:hypothetical protein BC939DRAFT_247579 [Gamsiella multidivaricata]|uniref:uncharacterized protein n=1 Tax=Gamsiella multidivaricata TaxID=101098 RepID=UPI0022211F16|nr:uncharacterized protein BC939DRAFT_247579 [Gamsiella multidivaricata]KAI7819772.1 hypothetical protein BC939DRAFT_247579 [Gamsiella multidivaricata]
MTGSRDRGIPKRKSSTSSQGQGHMSPPYSGHSSDFDVVGHVAGYGKMPNEKGKVRSSEVLLLSDEDEKRDPKAVKRKKMVQPGNVVGQSSSLFTGKAGSFVSRMKKDSTASEPLPRTSISSSVVHSSSTASALNQTAKPRALNTTEILGTSNLMMHPTAPNSIAKPTVSKLPMRPTTPNYIMEPVTPSSMPKPAATTFAPSSHHPKHLSYTNTPLSGKAPALGMGTFPQASLTCVRLGSRVEFTKPSMAVQFGPDRLIITIEKNVTKIPHDEIKSMEVGQGTGRKKKRDAADGC